MKLTKFFGMVTLHWLIRKTKDGCNLSHPIRAIVKAKYGIGVVGERAWFRNGVGWKLHGIGGKQPEA